MKRIYMLLCTLLICGCSSSYKLITNPNCSPPCWNGMTPGRTTVEEVKESFPFTKEVRDDETGWAMNLHGYSDYFIWSYLGNRITGQMGFHDHVLSQITIFGQLDLSLQKAISFFGTPESIAVSESIISNLHKQARMVNILFPEDGVSLMFYSYNMTIIRLRPNTDIISVSYVDPSHFRETLEERITQISPSDFMDRYFPWQGYIDMPINKE